MKLTFVSNYINHHQIPFSEACYGELREDYCFIQTEPMEEERIKMGWNAETAAIPYVRCMYEEEAHCREIIANSDVAIFGWTRENEIIENLIKQRIDVGKPTLRVSERLYREGQWKAISPKGLIKKYKDHTRYRNKNVCLLCSGAYVASDFHIVRAYPNKMLRFGYFPETIRYTEEQLGEMKAQDGRLHIVWAGRFMPLKHPEFVTALARDLKMQNAAFHIHMVGGGELEQAVKEQIKTDELQDVITLYGFRKPEEVRRIMEKCHIHLFTSNHLEGWGAVLNEAMNSGCAVIANVEAGGAPFLIQNGKNGLIYDGTYGDFAAKVRKLLEDKQEIKRLGKEAYKTIAQSWNAGHAAKELLRFCDDMQRGRIIPAEEGPLSPAPVVSPRKMYRKVLEHKI